MRNADMSIISESSVPNAVPQRKRSGLVRSADTAETRESSVPSAVTKNNTVFYLPGRSDFAGDFS